MQNFRYYHTQKPLASSIMTASLYLFLIQVKSTFILRNVRETQNLKDTQNLPTRNSYSFEFEVTYLPLVLL